MGDGANQLQPPKAMAMALRSKNAYYRLADIQTRHWQMLARQSGVADAFAVMVRLVEHVPTALELVEKELPGSFPKRLWTCIRDGMLQHQRRFLEGLKTAIRE